LHELPDLRALLIAEIELLQHVHSTAPASGLRDARLQLRLLIGRQKIANLCAKRAAALRIRGAAARVRLTVLREELRNLLSLLIAEIQIAKARGQPAVRGARRRLHALRNCILRGRRARNSGDKRGEKHGVKAFHIPSITLRYAIGR